MLEIFDFQTELAEVDFGPVAEADFNAACDLAVTDVNLDHLLKVTDGANNFPNTAVDGSVVSKILSKVATGDTSSYDCTTDSLEAISDKVTLGALETSVTALSTAIDTLTETGGTVTTDGNEQTVYVNETPDGVFQPVCVKIDCTAHTATESITLKTYYRIKTGGNYILQDSVSYTLAVISPELISIDLEPNRYGVKVTIQKTAGTNRAYDWEAIYRV